MDFLKLKVRIPTGNSKFANLVKYDGIYVDKTKFIYELALCHGAYFLSRPRRFGKSTLISTFEELFTHGVKPYDGHDSYFKGMYIEDKWSDDNDYLIMKLDFAQLFVSYCKSVSEFEGKFVKVLNEFAQKFGIKPLTNAKVSDAFRNILEHVKDNSLVILVDEYDFSLTHNFNHPEVFEGITDILRGFYQQIKSNSGSFRFVFITGITRYCAPNQFMEGNFFDDITFKSEFGEIVGFTRDEIEHYFKDNLKYATSIRKDKAFEEVTNRDIESLVDELENMYGGYSFDKHVETKVFSTWSVLSFFENRYVKLEPYWFDNGGSLPPTLLNYVTDLQSPFLDLLKTGQTSIYKSRLLHPGFEAPFDEKALLFQTGYLTLGNGSNALCSYLKMPNQEVTNSLIVLYFGRVFKDTDKRAALKSCAIGTLKTSTEVVDYFNRILNAVDYEHYPLTQESAVTNSLFMFFNGYGLTHTNVNVHSSKGRADLIIEDSKRRIVCELKYAKESDNAESLLKEACLQIENREYGETEPKPQQILKLALVFSEKERKFTLYKEC